MARHVVLVGPLPPPVNGFSYITQEMAKAFAETHQLDVVDLSPHAPRQGISYHRRRVMLTVRGLVPLFRQRRNPARVLYVACEGNMGMIYTVTFAFVGRLLRYPIYVHHHSFGYIGARRWLMSWLLLALGREATHIFNCDVMAQGFVNRYRLAVKGVILSNSAFVQAPPQLRAVTEKNRPLIIGLLSNLNSEKGLDVFLDVLRQALALHMNIAAILAGPPQSSGDAELIAAASREFGDRFTYLGSIYGAAKDEFFRAIDVFVFPTRYVNESQPTVVFEALAYGVPVLSYARGCIGGQIGTWGAVLARGKNFPAFAIEWLNAQLSAPEDLASLRPRARAAFNEDQANSRKTLSRLFDMPSIEFAPAHDATRRGERGAI